MRVEDVCKGVIVWELMHATQMEKKGQKRSDGLEGRWDQNIVGA